MTNEEKEVLAGQLKLLKVRVQTTMKKLEHARSLVYELEHRHWKEKLEFENLDRKMAMIDGRYKILPAAGTRQFKKQIEVQLTVEQIQSIAAKLGINIETEESEDD